NNTNSIDGVFYKISKILISLALLANGNNLKSDADREQGMIIKIIYDNTSVAGYKADWGFSCVINDSILFDTGDDPEILRKNFELMGLKICDIKIVFLSHKHKDHTGGLKYLLNSGDFSAKIYCTSDTRKFIKKMPGIGNSDLEVIKEFSEIASNIYTTGIIDGTYKGKALEEQSLVIQNNGEIGIIAGCSHPGIIDIVKSVKEDFPTAEISFVIGGFHFVDSGEKIIKETAETLKSLSVKKAGPCHCSGAKAKNIFRKIYKDNFIEIDAGRILELNDLFKLVKARKK
ncbi:MBL fold metallo-hydrolase, partial [Bacteroidota bacterium]